jgi:hypothetical protein
MTFSCAWHRAYAPGACRYDLGAGEVAAFLEHLVVGRNVATSTQNQALNALVFLYDKVLEQPLGDLGAFRRSRCPKRLPVVLSRSDVATTQIYTLVLNRAGSQSEARSMRANGNTLGGSMDDHTPCPSSPPDSNGWGRGRQTACPGRDRRS